MPVVSRKALRQTLGKVYIRDTIVATSPATAASVAQPYYSPLYADAGLAGQGLYQNATIRQSQIVVAPTPFLENDYRVASFNAGSGGWVTQQIIQNTSWGSGSEFEVHSRISAAEKDLAIDETLKGIRVRQEVGIATGTAGADFFSIEGAASPNYITDLLDVYWFANPSGSLDRDLRHFTDFHLVMTATGREIRVAPAPGGSAQLVLDAILTLTLNSQSSATLNIPDDRWVLAGAAARCYDLLIANAPGQNAGELANRRGEWATEFTKLSSRFAPNYARTVRLEEPEDLSSLAGLLTW